MRSELDTDTRTQNSQSTRGNIKHNNPLIYHDAKISCRQICVQLVAAGPRARALRAEIGAVNVNEVDRPTALSVPAPENDWLETEVLFQHAAGSMSLELEDVHGQTLSTIQ